MNKKKPIFTVVSMVILIILFIVFVIIMHSVIVNMQKTEDEIGNQRIAQTQAETTPYLTYTEPSTEVDLSIEVSTEPITTTESIPETFTQLPEVNPLVLKRGDKGSAVRDLQIKLIDIGFYTGNITGDFGPLTEAAVMELQEYYNLTSDGVVQGETWVVLELATELNSSILPSQTEESLVEETKIKVKMYKSVKNVTASSTLPSQPGYSYYPSNIIDLDMSTCWVEGVDGYGEEEWIRLDFLKDEIIAGIDIWNGYCIDQRRFDINNRVKAADLEFSDGTKLPIYLADVMEMQTIIFDEITTSYIKLVIKDIYAGSRDDDTCISEIAVFGYEMQTENMILISPLSQITNPYTMPTRVLYWDSPLMIGDDVKWLQWELNRLGFGREEVTGTFGELTHRATVAFQTAYNLDPDGAFGPISLNKMLELLS